MSLAQYFSCHLARGSGDRPFDLGRLPASGGVFALAGAHDQVLLLSGGETLRRLVGARLYPPDAPNSRPRTDVLAITQQVWWEPTECAFGTLVKFHEISYQLYPREHLKMCRFGPCWFAVIDLADRFPRWLASRQPLLGRSACVGPFARRAQCQALVQHLEELFSLCREHPILEQTPRGQACAYFEMGRCPAPCDGTIPWSQYQTSLAQSVDWVVRQSPDVVANLRAAMLAASDTLDFEEAARRRLTIEHAEAAAGILAGRMLGLDDFRHLIVQRCGRRQRVQAFAVNQGAIRALDSVPLKSLADAVPQWRCGALQLAAAGASDPAWITERIWLVCHFLLLGGRAAGICMHVSDLADGDAAARRIRQATDGPRKPGLP